MRSVLTSHLILRKFREDSTRRITYVNHDLNLLKHTYLVKLFILSDTYVRLEYLCGCDSCNRIYCIILSSQEPVLINNIRTLFNPAIIHCLYIKFVDFFLYVYK